MRNFVLLPPLLAAIVALCLVPLISACENDDDLSKVVKAALPFKAAPEENPKSDKDSWKMFLHDVSETMKLHRAPDVPMYPLSVRCDSNGRLSHFVLSTFERDEWNNLAEEDDAPTHELEIVCVDQEKKTWVLNQVFRDDNFAAVALYSSPSVMKTVLFRDFAAGPLLKDRAGLAEVKMAQHCFKTDFTASELLAGDVYETRKACDSSRRGLIVRRDENPSSDLSESSNPRPARSTPTDDGMGDFYGFASVEELVYELKKRSREDNADKKNGPGGEDDDEKVLARQKRQSHFASSPHLYMQDNTVNGVKIQEDSGDKKKPELTCVQKCEAAEKAAKEKAEKTTGEKLVDFAKTWGVILGLCLVVALGVGAWLKWNKHKRSGKVQVPKPGPQRYSELQEERERREKKEAAAANTFKPQPLEEEECTDSDEEDKPASDKPPMAESGDDKEATS